MKIILILIYICLCISEGNHIGNIFVVFLRTSWGNASATSTSCELLLYVKEWSMYRKRRKFPVCLFHRTTSSLWVRSLRFAVVMRADEDSRTGRFNFLRSLHFYHSPFRSPSLAQRLIIFSLAGSFLSEISMTFRTFRCVSFYFILGNH